MIALRSVLTDWRSIITLICILVIGKIIFWVLVHLWRMLTPVIYKSRKLLKQTVHTFEERM